MNQYTTLAAAQEILGIRRSNQVSGIGVRTVDPARASVMSSAASTPASRGICAFHAPTGKGAANGGADPPPAASAPRPVTGPPEALDDRERAVLSMVADGHETAEIARKLAYSTRTVTGIVHDITARWRLRNRAHAVAYALRHGLI